MARLGTKARPAVIRAQTEQRARELFERCTEHGWDVIVGVEPDKPEDITDMLKLENPDAFTARSQNLPGRNEPCLCGSGAKFKKCCLSAQLRAPLHGQENGET
jgi:SWIM/SEC-C metal-binding protein